MRDLSRDVENYVLTHYQIANRVVIAKIGDADLDSLFESRYVRTIASMLGDHRVDDQNLCPKLDPLLREVGTDKAETSCHHHTQTAIILG
jgi:hypothetical protein